MSYFCLCADEDPYGMVTTFSPVCDPKVVCSAANALVVGCVVHCSVYANLANKMRRVFVCVGRTGFKV